MHEIRHVAKYTPRGVSHVSVSETYLATAHFLTNTYVSNESSTKITFCAFLDYSRATKRLLKQIYRYVYFRLWQIHLMFPMCVNVAQMERQIW